MPCGMSVILVLVIQRHCTYCHHAAYGMLCKKRCLDLWGSEVMNRLHGCIDLDAAEAVYLDNCLFRFLLYKSIPQEKLKLPAGSHCDLEKIKLPAGSH